MLKRLLARLGTKSGRDAVSTFAAEGLAVIGMVLAYRLAAQQGAHELDLYVVVRRTVSFAYPLVLIGAVVGLTRYVALARDEPSRRRYLRGALSWVLPFGLLLWVLAALLPGPTAWIVFGGPETSGLVAPLGAMVFGLCLHAVSYSFLRGRHFVHAANVLQLITLAVAPCGAFLLFNDMHTVLWATAAAWIVVPALALIPFLGGGGPASYERMELLRFGLPRVPGDLAFGALLTVPVYVVARTYGLDGAGKVGFGTTLLSMVAAVFSPVALMVLPTSAAKLARGEHAGLSRRIGQLSRVTIALGVLLTVGFELLARPMLLLYLGEAGEEHVGMCRLIFLGALPFAYFIGLRSVLDAYYHTPRNGINLIVAFAWLMFGAVLHLFIPTPEWTMSAALVASLFILGWSTYRDVQHVRSELDRLALRSSDAMNIVAVIPAKEGSGAYPFAYRQAQALAREHNATVTYFHLDSRTSLWKLLKARRRFKRLLKEARPDVVLAYYGSVSSFFTVLSSAMPVVVSFQGSDINRTPSDGYWRDVFGRLFSQLSAFFAAGIVCVSDRLRAQLWWRNDEARVIPLGADLRSFTPLDRAACRRQLGWDEGARVVLFNGNNPAVKRLDIATRTIALVEAVMPGTRLEVLNGGISYDRMPVLLNAADALLLCSDSEGSPSMVKEAMACGLPVVCNDVGDTAERLRDVVPGAVVPQRADALADALVKVLGDGRRSNGRELAGRNGCDALVVDAELMRYLREVTLHA